jgi:hypothetical protein
MLPFGRFLTHGIIVHPAGKRPSGSPRQPRERD